MQLCIRAHDLGVKGTEHIIDKLKEYDIDGVQLVCYKAYEDISYTPGAVNPERAREIGRAFSEAGKSIPLLGAYFNPVHSLEAKRENGKAVFADYIKLAKEFGTSVVASETGSKNDDKWTYNPLNRTEESLKTVIDTFSELSEGAAKEQNGCCVAMEGAAGHVCFEPSVLSRAIEEIEKKTGNRIKVIFDLYNYMDASNATAYKSVLEEGLRIFSGRIHAFHMKDCIIAEGEAPKQVPFGTGDLDIPFIIKRIKEYDPDAVLVLEGTTGEYIKPAAEIIRTEWEKA